MRCFYLALTLGVVAAAPAWPAMGGKARLTVDSPRTSGLGNISSAKTPEMTSIHFPALEAARMLIDRHRIEADRIRPLSETPLGEALLPPTASAEAGLRSATLVSEHPMEQFLLWEQRDNRPQYRQVSNLLPISVAAVPAKDVVIQRLASARKEILDKFVRRELVAWLRHPYNTESRVPHATDESVESWLGGLTASRSVAFMSNGMTVKLPTDRVNPRGEQREKASARDDVLAAVPRCAHIESVDARLKPERGILVLKDVLSISDRRTGNGFVVRDISPLIASGRYYLPAFSIPYFGRFIAAMNGSSFLKFWSRHYGRALGRAKAKLLLRYGLQMETPNPQNFLVELDRRFRPTGRIVFRDLGDTVFVPSVARGLGFKERLEEDARRSYSHPVTGPMSQIPWPEGRKSFWDFRDARGQKWTFHKDPVASLVADVHDRAYFETVASDLDISRKNQYYPLIKAPPNFTPHPSVSLNAYLETPAGQQALADYQKRRER